MASVSKIDLFLNKLNNDSFASTFWFEGGFVYLLCY